MLRKLASLHIQSWSGRFNYVETWEMFFTVAFLLLKLTYLVHAVFQDGAKIFISFTQILMSASVSPTEVCPLGITQRSNDIAFHLPNRPIPVNLFYVSWFWWRRRKWRTWKKSQHVITTTTTVSQNSFQRSNSGYRQSGLLMSLDLFFLYFHSTFSLCSLTFFFSTFECAGYRWAKVRVISMLPRRC